jgi:hypothetical protein
MKYESQMMEITVLCYSLPNIDCQEFHYKIYAIEQKGPKIRGECCALAPYFRNSFANCVSPVIVF